VCRGSLPACHSHCKADPPGAGSGAAGHRGR
jgi:hypothetical protein